MRSKTPTGSGREKGGRVGLGQREEKDSSSTRSTQRATTPLMEGERLACHTARDDDGSKRQTKSPSSSTAFALKHLWAFDHQCYGSTPESTFRYGRPKL